MGAKQAILAQRAGSDPEVADWSRLLIGCRRQEYCASLIARAVEDCDAHILDLHVATPGAITGDAAADIVPDEDFPVQVVLKVSHRNSDGIGRSLERYGFTVLDRTSSESADQSRIIENYTNLMKYLEI